MADKLLTIGEVAEAIKNGSREVAELVGELANADASFAKDDRSFDCRLCGNRSTPSENQWIFYNLCDDCFGEFNAQKMRGRFRGFNFNIAPDSDPQAASHIKNLSEKFGGGLPTESYYESCDEWLKTKRS